MKNNLTKKDIKANIKVLRKLISLSSNLLDTLIITESRQLNATHYLELRKQGLWHAKRGSYTTFDLDGSKSLETTEEEEDISTEVQLQNVVIFFDLDNKVLQEYCDRIS